MKPGFKKFGDILSRFRNDVVEFSEKFGGVQQTKKNFKAPLPRKEKRKLERKLKHAKKLAFNRKQKAPTLDEIIISESKNKNKNLKDLHQTVQEKESLQIEPKQVKKDKKEKSKSTKDVKNVEMNTIQKIENRNKKEEKEKQMYLESYQSSFKENLLKDNENEEKEIRKLEKLLHIKKDSKKYKQAFYDEGFDDLLDFCDEEKRQEMIKNEMNAWLGEKESEKFESTSKKKQKIDKLNKQLEQDSENSDQSETEVDDQVKEKKKDDFFIKSNSIKKKVKIIEPESDESGSPLVSDEDRSPLPSDNEDEHNQDEDEDDEESIDEEDGDEENDSFSDEELLEEEDESDEVDDDEMMSLDEDDDKKPKSKKEPELKEDIYGRLVDKRGNLVKTEKYIPPAQRLKTLLEQSSSENSVKLQRLHKQINGLLNRLSTTNIISILNQIVQLVYSNQYTRYDIIETIYNLIESSLIKTNCITPMRLLVEHAALISALTTSVGVELGANMLQRLCQKLNKNISDECYFNIDNKMFDNLILFLCNLFHFKLFSSNLLIDLLNDNLIELIKNDQKLEKIIDLILLILRSVGFSLRKDAPIQLKDLIIKLQTKVNLVKNSDNSDETNNRLKFMLESINAIKNNDIRRLDSFDQQPIELIKKQMKNSFKEDQILLNISYNDLINADQKGRWWIVGSAWSNREETQVNKKLTIETEKQENGVFSEKILQLAKEQRMNTDIRKAIFCILISAEDYTDAFVKLVKLSLKKQQEREITYVIVHCALNEKKYNPYYSFLMQKFCEYDRRFKMTLQFHTWDKFKIITEMSKQQITNFSNMYVHLISSGAMSLSVLKNVEFGEMNKSILQFLRELFAGLFVKYNHEKIQEIFIKIATVKKFYQLRNALKLFIHHFMLTDKGKTIELDENLKEKCEFVEKILTLNSSD